MLSKIYICKRCEYDAKNKFYLEKHLNRKKPCEPLDEEHNINRQCLLDDLKPKYNDNAVSCRYCNKKFNTRANMYTHHKVCKKNPNNMNNSVQDSESTSEIVIELCENMTDNERVMLKHIQQLYEKDSQNDREIKVLKKQVEELMLIISNHIKKTNTIDITPTFNINNFGCEKIDHISDDLLYEFILNQLIKAKNVIDEKHPSNVSI